MFNHQKVLEAEQQNEVEVAKENSVAAAAAESPSVPVPESFEYDEEEKQEAEKQEDVERVSTGTEHFDLTMTDSKREMMTIEEEYEKLDNPLDDSMSDINTVVSETFEVAEDDVNIFVVNPEVNAGLNVDEDEDVMKLSKKDVQLLDCYNDETYAKVDEIDMHDDKLIPVNSLKADILGYQLKGVNAYAPSKEEFELFTKKMNSLPQAHEKNFACMFLGSIGKEGGLAEIFVRNSSITCWPEDTQLMLVHGDGCGFKNLKLDKVASSETCRIVMDFPASTTESSNGNDEWSFWCFTSGDETFGNMLCVKRHTA
jgi:hypothetical protein